MINNDRLQQINSFTGGMDLDTADQYLDTNKYREAFNLRVTTDMDGTHGSLTNIEGVRFFQHITTQLPSGYDSPRIIHVDSVRKYGLVLVKAINTSEDKEYYFIFRFINKDDLAENEDGTPKLIFGPCPTSLGENPSTVTRWEDEDNIKMYYADGEQPLRVINIAPALDGSRPMTDDGSMSIYPTATLSQPEFLRFGSGNLKTGTYQYGYQLFTRNGSETEVSPLTGLIQVTPTANSTGDSSSIQGGESGDVTSLSIQLRIPINDLSYNMIRIISVYYTNITDAPRIQVLREQPLNQVDGEIIFQDTSNQGLTDITAEEFNMITSVHFAPKLLETKNNYLFASDIKYRDSVFDVDYDARAYSGVLLSSNVNKIYTILMSESGDSTYVTDIDEILNGNVRIPANHDAINPFTDLSRNYTSFTKYYTAGMDLTNAKCAYAKFDSIPGTDAIWGGKGLNISWRFILTELEEISGDIKNTGSFSLQTLWMNVRYSTQPQSVTDLGRTPNATPRPFQGVWQSYVNSIGGISDQYQKFRQLSNEQITIPCNYSSQIIRSNCMSLQRDEVYRYGIVMYDKYGNSTPVKWIADIRTPSAYEDGFAPFATNTRTSFLPDGVGVDTPLASRPLGIEFDVNNLPEEVVAYEIVRVRRTDSDRATVTQGFVSKTYAPRSSKVEDVGPITTTHRFPTTLMYNGGTFFATSDNSDWSNYYVHYSNNPGVQLTDAPYTMFSPEICYRRSVFQDFTNQTNLRVEYLYNLFSARGTSVPTDEPTDIYSSIYNGMSIDGRIKEITNHPAGNYHSVHWLQPFGFSSSDGEPPTIVFNMYHRSGVLGQVQMLGNSSEPSHKIESGYISQIKRITLPNETDHTNFLNHLDFVTSVTMADGSTRSYVDWSASDLTVENGVSKLWASQGSHGRSIVFDAENLLRTSDGYFYLAMDRYISNDVYGFNKLSSFTKVTHRFNIDGTERYYYPRESMFGGLMCNLRRSIIPYGGRDYQSRQFSTYISQSAFAIKGTVTQSIFSGDTFINVLRYIKTHYYLNQNADGSVPTRQYPIVTIYNVPFESSINIALQNGQPFSPFMQKEPANVGNNLIQTIPMYRYNSVFSVESTVRPHTAEWYLDELNKHIDVRTHYSLKKSNDENVDSWTKFRPLNYLDVDSQYGSINNLRTFHTQLVFFQDNAIGVFQVEDRSLIQDNNNSALLLGTSGVMERYDYIHTKNGMKQGHHGTDCQSDTTLYFFDYDKNELCAYAQNSVISLGKQFNVQSYIERVGADTTLQSPKPILTYDKKYNEVFATLSASESLIYNERINAFSGFYTLTPTFRLYFDGDVYFVKDTKLYKYNDNMINNGFDDEALPIRLNYLVNAGFQQTKVFDNIEFTGELDKDEITFDFISSYIKSNTLSGDNLSMREYNYRGAIPRAETDEKFANRMRGRVLYCTMRYNQANFEGTRLITIINEEFMQSIVTGDNLITNNVQPALGGDGTRFELPYIRTTFRQSLS